jgi:NADH dehydrogenase FAD-containing subunit
MRTVRFGIVGGGLMGREFASAAARWLHLADMDVRPEIVHVCDANPDVLAWYERLRPTPRL